MAGTPERVKAFLDDIDRVVRPIGEADAARMLARLRQDDPSLGALNSWSTSYASRLVRKEDYDVDRSEEHTSELQSLMRNSYAVFCLKKKRKQRTNKKRY